MIESEVPRFAVEWVEIHRRAQTLGDLESYLVKEINEVMTSKVPLLRAILSHPNDECRLRCLQILQNGTVETREQLLEMPQTFALKLVEDAQLPERGPDGNPLKTSEKGSLVVKVGNVGGNIPNTEITAGMHGKRRIEVQHFPGALYTTVKVEKTPKFFPLETAVKILQSWGVGVATRAFDKPADGSRARPGAAPGQQRWLVEEASE